jgi:hypothetical protein
MIGFRYHVVSLTAVFLALAIGVIAGSNVIPRPLIQDLRNERNRITANNATLRTRTAGLERQVAMWDRYGDGAFEAGIAGALKGVTVVRMIVGAPPKDLLERIDATLSAAGAGVGGSIVLTDRTAVKDERDRDALGTVLAVAHRDPADLWRDLGERLATRLQAPADPRAETDLLRLLDDHGFLRLEDVEGGAFPARRAVFLIISSGERGLGPAAASFLLPFATEMAGARAVIAEPLVGPDVAVEEIRAIVEVRDSLGTIDHVDTSLGRYGMVAALAREASGGRPLHLGIGERAAGLAPDAVRPTSTPPAAASPSPSPT